MSTVRKKCWTGESSVLAAIILLISAQAAVADSAEIVYYDIVGDSAKELRSQLNGSGPFGKNGKRSDGRADCQGGRPAEARRMRW